MPNYYVLLTFIVANGVIVLAQKWNAGSQMQALLSVKFGWDTKEEQHNKFQLITACTVIAMSIGNAVGGKAMQVGRKRILLAGLILLVIG